MPQQDDGASQVHIPEDIVWVVFPTNDGATKVMKPGEQAFHFPPTPVAVQNTPVLHRGRDGHEFMGRDELHAVSFVNALIQGIAVTSAVADHTFREFGKESLVERRFDELCFMMRSAGDVHGERNKHGRRDAIILLPSPRLLGPTPQPLFSRR